MSNKIKALFLDRDGTINIDPGYINHPNLIKLLPGAAAAIKRARDQGYAIAVITNQSGVGRGLIEPGMLQAINARLNELLEAEAGSSVDYFACCIHRPDEHCRCRKPLPRLVYEAQAHLGIDLDESIFIGDRLIDVKTGKSAPVRFTVLVRSGEGKGQEALLANLPQAEAPDFIADDLAHAVDWVLRQKSVS